MNFNNLVVAAAAAGVVVVVVVVHLQAKYSRLFNLGEMSYFNQRNAVQ